MKSLKNKSIISIVYNLQFFALLLCFAAGPSLADPYVDLGAPSKHAQNSFINGENKRVAKALVGVASKWMSKADSLYKAARVKTANAENKVMFDLAIKLSNLSSQASGDSPLKGIIDIFGKTPKTSSQTFKSAPATIGTPDPNATSTPGPDPTPVTPDPGDPTPEPTVVPIDDPEPTDDGTVDDFINFASLSGEYLARARALSDTYKAELNTIPADADPATAETYFDQLLTKYQGLLDAANSRLAVVVALIAQLQTQIDAIDVQLADNQTQLNAVAADLSSQQTTLAGLNTRLSALQAHVPIDQAQIDDVNNQIAQVNAAIAADQAEQSRLQGVRADLQAQRADLVTQQQAALDEKQMLETVDIPFFTGVVNQMDAAKGNVSSGSSPASQVDDILSGLSGGTVTLTDMANILAASAGALKSLEDEGTQYLLDMTTQFTDFSQSMLGGIAGKLAGLLESGLKDNLGALVKGVASGLLKAVWGLFKDAIVSAVPKFVRKILGLATAPGPQFSTSAASRKSSYASVPVCKGKVGSSKRVKCEAKRAAAWKKFKNSYTRYRKKVSASAVTILTQLSINPKTGESIPAYLARMEAAQAGLGN